ncbi:MAG: hypothetical protein HPY76_10910 [Anaerolineae bacterium]|nr:hypothetical protein [Anaerolineae bacterium]
MSFTPLLIVIALAFLVPLLLSRFKAVPVIVGEIVAGILLAVSGLVPAGESELLILFSDIGLAFLMFLAGIEVNLQRLFIRNAPHKPKQLPIPLLASFIYAATLALGVAGGYLLVAWGLEGNPHLLALILTGTSLGVLLPILKTSGILNDDEGQLVFITAAMADFLTVILMTVVVILQTQGLSLEILSILLIFVAFLVAARIGMRYFRIPAVQRFFDDLSHTTVQLKVRGAIVILLAFVVLSQALGIELILGAFLAGMLVSLFKSPEDEGLIPKLEAFGFGLFIPVFFINTGVNLDITSLFANPRSLVLLPALLGVSLVVKVLPALLLRLRTPWRETISSGILLNTHLSLEVAVAIIGERLGLFTPAATSLIILFCVVTVLVMPLLYQAIHPRTSAQPLRWHLIAGFPHPLAGTVARELAAHGDEVRYYLPQGVSSDTAEMGGFESVREEHLAGLAGEVRTFLVLGSKDGENEAVVNLAQGLGISQLVVLVNEPGNLERFKALGVQVFSPMLYRPTILTLMARNPSFLELLTSTVDDRELLEVCLCNREIGDRALKDIHLPGDSLVLSVNRAGEVIIPHGSTRLEQGDIIAVLVDRELADQVRAYLEGLS